VEAETAADRTLRQKVRRGYVAVFRMRMSDLPR